MMTTGKVLDTPETDDRFVPVPLANETTDSNAGNTKMTSNY